METIFNERVVIRVWGGHVTRLMDSCEFSSEELDKRNFGDLRRAFMVI